MNRLFKSTELQKQFDEDGFVKVALLSTQQVIELQQAYKSVAAEHEGMALPYITTSHSNNHELITKVDNLIQPTLSAELSKVLTNYRLLFGNFLVKMPVSHSETDPHQDITFVDESKYTSVNVWVPLQDVNKNNGCMYFLPGSHQFIPTIRPTHHYPWPYENVKNEIKEKSIVFEARAGEAFIFNHAVIHGSFANNGATPRIAVVVAAYNESAPLIHYFLPDINKPVLQKYSMTKNAFLSFVKQQPPTKGIYLGDEPFNFKQLSKQEFSAIYEAKRLQRSGLLQRLKQLFN